MEPTLFNILILVCLNSKFPPTLHSSLEIPGDQEGLLKLAIQLRKFFIRRFTTLQPDMFCGFI
jgi:hypothetical protein